MRGVKLIDIVAMVNLLYYGEAFVSFDPGILRMLSAKKPTTPKSTDLHEEVEVGGHGGYGWLPLL